ncbi:MerR family DNA-binding transcriptional regulator [Deinococcus peraridilitoris]|uniref:MerR family DNA-binding transcriptional regulator n=1 Tax=Deinococcus peraridilitoris TaxID=432329 RepID=UPI00030C6DDC
MTTKTIRHCHALGLVPEPPRAENGYRLYEPGTLMQFRYTQPPNPPASTASGSG